MIKPLVRAFTARMPLPRALSVVSYIDQKEDLTTVAFYITYSSNVSLVEDSVNTFRLVSLTSLTSVSFDNYTKEPRLW